MTVVVVVVLVLVAIVALVVDERRRKRATPVAGSWETDRSREMLANPRQSERALSSLPAPVEERRPARKPRATEQGVFDELKRIGPSTARELATSFSGASPAIVAGLLVRLRGDGRVTSEQRRNLQVWKAS